MRGVRASGSVALASGYFIVDIFDGALRHPTWGVHWRAIVGAPSWFRQRAVVEPKIFSKNSHV